MPNVNLNQDGEFDAELAVPDVDAVSTAQKSKKQGSQPGLLFFLVWIVEIVVICFVGLVVLASWWLVTTLFVIIIGSTWYPPLWIPGLLLMVGSIVLPVVLVFLWGFAIWTIARIGFLIIREVHRRFSEAISPSLSNDSDYARY
jgi:hypothetical protein